MFSTCDNAHTPHTQTQTQQVHMFSYQCSQHSTPQSVIEVFSTAQRFQKDQDPTQYVSVVVLDEVGLAEDSPNLPLKALHPLLEDGTEGADDSSQVCLVAMLYFVGLCAVNVCDVCVDYQEGAESGFHWDLQLGPGPSKDEQRRDGHQGQARHTRAGDECLWDLLQQGG